MGAPLQRHGGLSSGICHSSALGYVAYFKRLAVPAENPDL